MDYKIEKKFSIKLSEIDIIKSYTCEINRDFPLYSVSTISNPQNNTIIFTKNKVMDFTKVSQCLIIIEENLNVYNYGENAFIKVKNPRLEYAKVLRYIIDKFDRRAQYNISENGYYIGSEVKIGKNTIIEPFVFIDNNVVIGNNCHIKTGAKIREYTNIGNECIINENCVIGSTGFGLEKDELGEVYRIPHLGGVVIKDKVEVGALVSIASGTIEPTVIGENVKIDDCVFIAHNCYIGKSTFVVANAEISGSVNIGENCWIGPNASIIQKIKIGNNTTVGIGSVVTKNVGDNLIVAGNPADNIEYIKAKRRIEKKMIGLP